MLCICPWMIIQTAGDVTAFLLLSCTLTCTCVISVTPEERTKFINGVPRPQAPRNHNVLPAAPARRMHHPSQSDNGQQHPIRQSGAFERLRLGQRSHPRIDPRDAVEAQITLRISGRHWVVCFLHGAKSLHSRALQRMGGTVRWFSFRSTV